MPVETFLQLLFFVSNASEAVTLSYTANTLTHACSTVYACRKTHKQVYAFILEKHTAASCSTLAAAEEPKKHEKRNTQDLVFLLCGIQMSYPEAKRPLFDLFLTLDLTHRNFIPLQSVWAHKWNVGLILTTPRFGFYYSVETSCGLRPQWCIKCFTAGLSLWCCSSFHVPFHCCNTEA